MNPRFRLEHGLFLPHRVLRATHLPSGRALKPNADRRTIGGLLAIDGDVHVYAPAESVGRGGALPVPWSSCTSSVARKLPNWRLLDRYAAFGTRYPRGMADATAERTVSDVLFRYTVEMLTDSVAPGVLRTPLTEVAIRNGMLMNAAGHPVEAIAYFQAGLGGDRTVDGALLTGIGFSYVRLGRLDDAVDAFQSGLTA